MTKRPRLKSGELVDRPEVPSNAKNISRYLALITKKDNYITYGKKAVPGSYAFCEFRESNEKCLLATKRSNMGDVSDRDLADSYNCAQTAKAEGNATIHGSSCYMPLKRREKQPFAMVCEPGGFPAMNVDSDTDLVTKLAKIMVNFVGRIF